MSQTLEIDLPISSRFLGDYEVIKQIGVGSLGKVFLVEHRFLKKTFVIKVLPEELSQDRPFIQRFEKEVALLGTLDHPNIVKIHNVSSAEGIYFLVTDCIVDSLNETTNLAKYLKDLKRPLSEEEIFNIATQIASALDYAHEKKSDHQPFAHQGIKLNNVLIGQGKEQKTQVYLSDFGLSRIIGTGAVLSRTYQVVSNALEIDRDLIRKYQPSIDAAKFDKLHESFLQNYAFLAPERKVGDESAKDAGMKGDVYAFGVLVYYLIANQFPEGLFELPSVIRPDLKGHWDLLIYRCMQSNAAKRPNYLGKLLQEIQSSEIDGHHKQAIHHWNHLSDLVETKGKVTASTAKEAPKPVLNPQVIARPEYETDPAAALQVDTTVAKYKPAPAEVKNIEPILTDMVVIEGGTFLRGSNNGGRDEMPRHAIHLNSFAIDIHPVTNEQFVRFLEAMGGEKDVNNNDLIRLRFSRIKRMGGKLSIESGYAKHPVVGVSWYGAIAYAKWVGKRLPTEAEWETAAYGGLEGAFYPTGDNIERPQANFFSADTTSVMSYPPNGYGLYDMSGNVYEWVQDWYAYNYYDLSVQEPNDPKGPMQGVYRVLRGGCWKSLKEDLRCAHRHRNNPGSMNGTYGFRCAADVTVGE